MATIDSAASASAVWNDGSSSSTRNNRVACASSSSPAIMSSTLPSATAAATEAANSGSSSVNNMPIRPHNHGPAPRDDEHNDDDNHQQQQTTTASSTTMANRTQHHNSQCASASTPTPSSPRNDTCVDGGQSLLAEQLDNLDMSADATDATAKTGCPTSTSKVPTITTSKSRAIATAGTPKMMSASAMSSSSAGDGISALPSTLCSSDNVNTINLTTTTSSSNANTNNHQNNINNATNTIGGATNTAITNTVIVSNTNTTIITTTPPLPPLNLHHPHQHHHNAYNHDKFPTTATAQRQQQQQLPPSIITTTTTTFKPACPAPLRLKRNLAKTQSLDIVDEDLNEAQHAAALMPARTSSISPPAASTMTATSGAATSGAGCGDRPIYPNVPYSPYGSPYGSPRGRKRQPFRESRRISMERNESFLQLNQYKLYDKIGQGSFGLVKLAYSEEDSTHYAMKIMSKRKLERMAGLIGRGPKRGPVMSPLARVYREIAVLKKLDHPNVVKLIEVLDDPLEDSLYLVFEWLELGSILTVPTDTPLTEQRAWSVFRDALLGLEYLHYQRIIHRDLKPDNLLVGKNGRVQIADLGVCNEFDGNDASMSNVSEPGTPAFRAPETLVIGQHSYNGRAVDIWALGATLYALVFGKVPFDAETAFVLYERIRVEPLRFPDESSTSSSDATATASSGATCSALICISAELRHLISGMMEKDTEKRMTLPQIKLDAWVTRSGADALPSEAENCCQLVNVTEDDISSVVKSIPKLDTLILIKNMLKKHSFQNPYAPKSTAGQARIERFVRAGRSNSAPGAYHGIERQLSNDSLLPPVSEVVGMSSEPLAEEDAQDA